MSEEVYQQTAVVQLRFEVDDLLNAVGSDIADEEKRFDEFAMNWHEVVPQREIDVLIYEEPKTKRYQDAKRQCKELLAKVRLEIAGRRVEIRDSFILHRAIFVFVVVPIGDQAVSVEYEGRKFAGRLALSATQPLLRKRGFHAVKNLSALVGIDLRPNGYLVVEGYDQVKYASFGMEFQSPYHR